MPIPAQDLVSGIRSTFKQSPLGSMFCCLKDSLCSVSTHTFGKTEQNCDRGDKDSVGRAKGKENSCVVALEREQPEGHCSQGRVNEGKVSRRDQIVLSLGFDSEWDRA